MASANAALGIAMDARGGSFTALAELAPSLRTQYADLDIVLHESCLLQRGHVREIAVWTRRVVRMCFPKRCAEETQKLEALQADVDAGVPGAEEALQKATAVSPLWIIITRAPI